MPEEYKAFVNDLTPEGYNAFVVNLPLGMTQEEYKAFVDNPTSGITPEKYKILHVETFARLLPPKRYKTLLVKTLARTLPPERYRTLPVETLVRTLPSEKFKVLPVKILAHTLLSERRYKTLLVETLARTLPPKEHKASAAKLLSETHRTITRQVVVERTAKVIVDAFVVMRRIREDSDSIHGILRQGFEKLGDDPAAALENIGKYLQSVDEALAAMPHIKTYMKQMDQKISAVPAMAAHMDLMNRNIASMTTSMGSTMGRMGKWMPLVTGTSDPPYGQGVIVQASPRHSGKDCRNPVPGMVKTVGVRTIAARWDPPAASNRS